jgi:AcrR family transcriptional regulator
MSMQSPSPSAAQTSQKEHLLESAAQFFMAHGCNEHSLRGVAAAIGTSHRMLIHHFGDAEKFWIAVIDRLRRVEQASILGQPDKTGEQNLPRLEELWVYLTHPAHLQMFQLMFEIYLRALRNRKHYEEFLHDVVQGWLSRLTPAYMKSHQLDGPQAQAQARLDLAVVRGLILDLLNTGDLAGTTAALHRYAQGRATFTKGDTT